MIYYEINSHYSYITHQNKNKQTSRREKAEAKAQKLDMDINKEMDSFPKSGIQ